jgi:alpha-beta hydrolase superfamily lysophospholipase
MAKKKEKTEFVLKSILLRGVVDGVEELELQTNAGLLVARFHPIEQATDAIIWVGGTGGGLDGPARGMYPRLAGQLAQYGIASLRLHYRRPGYLEECIMDTMLAVTYLAQARQCSRIALVGHSFGGAVVISAGALSENIAAVVAMSSQTYGTDLAPQISPHSLLVLHGTADEVLSDRCAHDIYARAKEPKKLLLYPGCRHGLDECQDQVDKDVVEWLRAQFDAKEPVKL